MHPLCKILNTAVISICLVKQNDGTWVEKYKRFLFNVYKRFFFIFVTFFYVSYFFLEHFLHLWLKQVVDKSSIRTTFNDLE